ncbi:hypothetical protein L6164_019611 [Bauhinia variegata]|uniref:Uncharacterized protein n=1 Tax=Bauhinia variegata TaxID=167791 RepID=A0ACB9MSS1_BAUVA|nr:hypothetical protein L6164_019611 [Bauhinia variegata]
MESVELKLELASKAYVLNSGLKLFHYVQVNTQAHSNVIDCSDRKNSKYYVLYIARFNAKAVKKFLYTLNNGNVAKKKFNLRLAPEETSSELTGFVRNVVTCIGICKQTFRLRQPFSLLIGYMVWFQVILDEAIVKLTPDFFWLGGGEVDLKLGIRTSQLIRFVKPFIVNCSNN